MIEYVQTSTGEDFPCHEGLSAKKYILDVEDDGEPLGLEEWCCGGVIFSIDSSYQPCFECQYYHVNVQQYLEKIK